MPPEDRNSSEFRQHQLAQADVDPDLLAPSRRRVTRQSRAAILLAIAAGGAAGTPVRYALGRIIHVAPGSFPWSTFTINISGSLALGVLVTLIIERWPPTRYVRPFAAIGFLGAYTTFSTYMLETAVLTKDGYADIATAYVVASLAAGFIAVYVGIVIARILPLRREAS